MGWIELAGELETAHQNFMRTAAQLPPAVREKQGLCGTWSAKDIVAHLVGWDTEAVHFLGLFADGRGDTYDPSFDIDAYNARSVSMRAALSWDEVMLELTSAHADLQQMIQVLQAKELDSSGGFGSSLIGRKEDYLLHTEQLATWLPAANS